MAGENHGTETTQEQEAAQELGGGREDGARAAGNDRCGRHRLREADSRAQREDRGP